VSKLLLAIKESIKATFCKGLWIAFKRPSRISGGRSQRNREAYHQSTYTPFAGRAHFQLLQTLSNTSEERLIYRQACHDQCIFDLADGYSDIILRARAELLKRCAHFDMGQTADCVDSAIESLGTRKRERVDNLEQQLGLEVARMRVFKMWESKGKDILFSATRLHDDAKW
jgi:hypothetical protein